MRFAVLEHSQLYALHYDLLFELPTGQLEAWQFPLDPFSQRIQSVRLLVPHRRLYLNYQGRSADHARSVRQLAVGQFQLMNRADDFVCCRLNGNSRDSDLAITGIMSLHKLNEAWRAEWFAHR